METTAQLPVLVQGRIRTPLGDLVLITDAGGVLHAAEWADAVERLPAELGAGAGGGVPPDVAAAFRAYFAGDLGSLQTIPMASQGTPFQRQVWSAVRSIPPGTTLTYGGLARMLARPRASRAVGHANGANPFSVVVPCHRLVGSNGSLIGYGGGLPRKQWLLAHEARYSRRLSTAPGGG